MSCGVLDPVKPQRYNVYDRAHADLREFIERTRAADELLQIKGANWNLEIGALAEIVNHARPEPPANCSKTSRIIRRACGCSPVPPTLRNDWQ
jgi:hypothetical protein